MPLTYFSTNKFINVLNGSGSYPTQNTYFGLSTTTPTLSGGSISEPTIGTGAYARVLSNTATYFAAANGTANNQTAITFPVSSASWSTGATNLTTLCVFDLAVSGNLVSYSALTNPAAVNSAGVTVSLAANSYVTTLS
jgi:hypothetical protein